MPAKSIKQQRLMGMALAYKRGEISDVSDTVKKLADTMSEKDLEDFAKTKHDNLPYKVEENITPGSIPGMGPVTFPDSPGSIDGFTSQSVGSGDIPMGTFLSYEDYKKRKKEDEEESDTE